MPRNWGANITLLSSMSVRGMGPCLAVESSTTREVFQTYVEHVLAPSLRSGQVVVMDNQPLILQRREDKGAHRGEGMRVVVSAALLARSQPH